MTIEEIKNMTIEELDDFRIDEMCIEGAIARAGHTSYITIEEAETEVNQYKAQRAEMIKNHEFIDEENPWENVTPERYMDCVNVRIRHFEKTMEMFMEAVK